MKELIVRKAKEMLGKPYKWGGDTPEEGFDCSGFVYYVYKNSTQIDIGRTTCDQIKQGVSITKNQLQIGDVVFFGSEDIPHHVGIYLGNDEYIHAPKSGDVIKISKLSNRNDYVAARRYF
ncbi:TPA: C40 family peptidase [Clostridium botulinum]|nr:C40 family peptidase [Clostridium botulinum]HDK7206502.1 C40 family peptidase [Clostridium botulinum]HDK7210237.1 C40 family peptidase [Clostridium botulinum]HDK7265687.1 C40 family peptidase [Clostridium botulinum]HDK7269534.1 C40 family peptidase [Clostridium botulinum]